MRSQYGCASAVALLMLSLFAYATEADAAKVADAVSTYRAPYADAAPMMDGVADDAVWADAPWRNIDRQIIGDAPDSAEDFSGRYKAVWRGDALYLLAEIHDDRLIDSHADPLQRYWEDDALEIFVDEDGRGGNHQYSYDAFAYHIALDNQAVDIAPFRNAEEAAAGTVNVRTFPAHVQARWARAAASPHPVLWEVRIALYSDQYRDDVKSVETAAVALHAGKRLGFMVAYCDSDTAGEGREHFYGDVEIAPVDGDRNRGYIDASVFGTMELVERSAVP
jgi:hypothetical protein